MEVCVFMFELSPVRLNDTILNGGSLETAWVTLTSHQNSSLFVPLIDLH